MEQGTKETDRRQVKALPARNRSMSKDLACGHFRELPPGHIGSGVLGNIDIPSWRYSRDGGSFDEV